MSLSPYGAVVAFAGGYVILSALQLVLYKRGYARGRQDGEVAAATDALVAAIRGIEK
jgi:hypothetical protein